jgi:hypothetical protein
MSGVERLFSEAPGPTVVNCDWCGAVATVCSVAERSVGGTPARIGFCEEHHAQLLSASTEKPAGGGSTADERRSERAAYERRRSERDAELRRQRNAWRQRKAARQADARARLGERRGTPLPREAAHGAPSSQPVPASADEAAKICPQDSEELVAAILQGERPVSAVQVVDPRLEDPTRRLERLQDALWPLVHLAEECGIYVDCNPSQTHSVLVAGEVPVQALFRARDLLKRESER